jgi:hypothetical protein
VGSSIFHFKKLGLALDILCSSRTESAPGFQIFSINIDLTIQGLGELIALEKKTHFSFIFTRLYRALARNCLYYLSICSHDASGRTEQTDL